MTEDDLLVAKAQAFLRGVFVGIVLCSVVVFVMLSFR